MEPRISIITLGVADLADSVRFYRDGLGLPMREGGDGIAFFETKGTWLALFPRDALAADATVPADGAGFRGFTLAHNVRSREEVDALLREATRPSCSPLGTPHHERADKGSVGEEDAGVRDTGTWRPGPHARD